MSHPILPHRLPAPDASTYVVGQDAEGRWLAVDARGLGGGLFRSRGDALHYAAAETGRRPGAVRIAEGIVRLGL